MSLAVGSAAPDFTLKDQNQKEIRLSDFSGRKTSCWFFIHWTGVRSARTSMLVS